MAKYNFKQAALLGGGLGLAPLGPDGKPLKGADGKVLKQTGGGHRHLYPKGIHEVKDEKHLSDPTFKHLAKHGLIVKVSAKDAPKELKPASSGIALASQKAAKSQTGTDVSPDAEIGGEEDDGDPECVQYADGAEVVEGDGELSEEDGEVEGEESEEGSEADGEPTFEGDGDGHQEKKKKKKKKRG